jgi:fatty-acid desaturase
MARHRKRSQKQVSAPGKNRSAGNIFWESLVWVIGTMLIACGAEYIKIYGSHYGSDNIFSPYHCFLYSVVLISAILVEYLCFIQFVIKDNLNRTDLYIIVNIIVILVAVSILSGNPESILSRNENLTGPFLLITALSITFFAKFRIDRLKFVEANGKST